MAGNQRLMLMCLFVNLLLSDLEVTHSLGVRRTITHQHSLSRIPRLNCGSDSGDMKVNVRMLNGIDNVTRDSWNNLVEDKHPFLLYDWLLSLEKSGCASAKTGWQPLHLVAEKLVNEEKMETELIAAMPLYAKSHSYGEFIFDQSWADYAQRVLGIKYYPKLLAAVPFTPATGSRLLLSNTLTSIQADGIYSLMMNAMKTLMRQNNLSGAHVNFLKGDQVNKFLQNDFVLRQTVQYRWNNVRLKREGNEQKFQDMGRKDNMAGTNKEESHEEGEEEEFSTFDDYLTCFKSKRRTQIRRERKSVYEEQGILIKTIRGNDPVYATPELYQKMYEIYTTTIDKMWGQRYLTSDFFSYLHEAPSEFKERIVFIVAYDPNQPPPSATARSTQRKVLNFVDELLDLKSMKSNDHPREGRITVSKDRISDHEAKDEKGEKDPFTVDNIIAGTINLVSDTHFYGRYWGALEYRKHLHFETCYYKSIEYCIENRLKFLEPGAGGGEFKFLRGFDPFLINSMHTFSSPILEKAVADFVEGEREYNEELQSFLLNRR